MHQMWDMKQVHHGVWVKVEYNTPWDHFPNTVGAKPLSEPML